MLHYSNKFNILQNVCENCNLFHCSCKSQTKTNIIEERPGKTSKPIVNDEHSQSSVTTSVNFERSRNDCITVTTCCVSENQQPFHTIDNLSENNVPLADIY